MDKISFSDSQTIEMWLPEDVVIAIATDNTPKHFVIVQDKDWSKISWYVNGVEVYKESAKSKETK